MPKYSPDNKDSPKAQDTTTVVSANKNAPTLEDEHYTKMVAYGLSYMRFSHQNSINYSSRQNSMMTRLWN